VLGIIIGVEDTTGNKINKSTEFIIKQVEADKLNPFLKKESITYL
jgi:hypothetical protein